MRFSFFSTRRVVAPIPRNPPSRTVCVLVTDSVTLRVSLLNLNPTNEQAVADLLIRLGRQGGFSAYGAWWTITEYKFSSEVKSSVAVVEPLDLAIDDLRREEVTVGDLERLKKGNFRKDVLRRWKQKYPSDVR